MKLCVHGLGVYESVRPVRVRQYSVREIESDINFTNVGTGTKEGRI